MGVCCTYMFMSVSTFPPICPGSSVLGFRVHLTFVIFPRSSFHVFCAVCFSLKNRSVEDIGLVTQPTFPEKGHLRTIEIYSHVRRLMSAHKTHVNTHAKDDDKPITHNDTSPQRAASVHSSAPKTTTHMIANVGSVQGSGSSLSIASKRTTICLAEGRCSGSTLNMSPIT